MPTCGRIAKGMEGDVVVLSADPAGDPRNFAKVACTVRNGKIIYRSNKKRGGRLTCYGLYFDMSEPIQPRRRPRISGQNSRNTFMAARVARLPSARLAVPLTPWL